MGPSTVQKTVVALGYALLQGFATIQATTTPASVEGWVALVGSMAITFWGKFSSSRTVISAVYKG